MDARAEDALKLIESRELPERAIALLATMTPRSARVLALLANGLTYAQIAERTGMKIGTVWSCASRARECALRELGTNDMRRVIDLLR